MHQKNEQKHFCISALAFKKTSNQKRTLYSTNWRILFWLSYTSFLIWPLFIGYGRNTKNIFVHFLVQMKTLKSPFYINWPLIGKDSSNHETFVLFSLKSFDFRKKFFSIHWRYVWFFIEFHRHNPWMFPRGKNSMDHYVMDNSL